MCLWLKYSANSEPKGNDYWQIWCHNYNYMVLTLVSGHRRNPKLRHKASNRTICQMCDTGNNPLRQLPGSAESQLELGLSAAVIGWAAVDAVYGVGRLQAPFRSIWSLEDTRIDERNVRERWCDQNGLGHVNNTRNQPSVTLTEGQMFRQWFQNVWTWSNCDQLAHWDFMVSTWNIVFSGRSLDRFKMRAFDI